MSATLFHLLTFSLVGVPAAQGLLALWAATSRRHWFVRALAVWGGIVVLIPIRAYEPAVVLAIASVVIVQLVRTRRRLGHWQAKTLRTEPVQFGLRDLLLFMLLAGLIIVTFQALNRYYSLRDWVALAITGSVAAAVVCLSAAFVAGPRRWLMGLLLVIAIVAAAPLTDVTAPQTKAEIVWAAFGAQYGVYLSSLIAVGRAYAELAAVIIVALTLGYLPWPNRSVWLRSAHGGVLVLAGVECVWLAWLYCQMLWLTPFPPPFVGGANNYRRIAEISQLLGGNRGRGRAPGADVRALASEAQRLLETSNFVEMSGAVGSLRSDVDHIAIASGMRELARVFETDAKTAMVRNEFDRAAELGVPNLRLGIMLNRGGTVVDALVGTSCETVGLANIVPSRASLSPDRMRSTIAELQRVLAEEEAINTIAQRDAAFEERIGGWQIRLEIVIQKTMGVGSAGAQALIGARRRLAARNVLLQADLAIRLYQHDHSDLPKSLADLVPTYLPEVPRDPFSASGDFIHYRIDGEAFLLYSVGMDGKDNGGTLAPTNQAYWRNWQHPLYDYDLETDTR